MPTPLKFAVAASTLTDNPRLAPRLSREAGFDGLQFDAYSPALRIPDLSATGRREFAHLLAAQSQHLVGLRGDLGPKGFGPGADVDRLLNGLDRAMEAARSLSSPLLCLDLGPLPEPPRPAKPKPAISPQQAGLILLPDPTSFAKTTDPTPTDPPPDPAFVAQLDAALGELGTKADRYGTVLAFRSDLASFAAIDACLRRVRCPWFGLDLDPAAVLRDDWPLDEILSHFAPLIRHVRGRDATRGAHRRTKPAPLARGDTDWPHLLASLDAADYTRWITLDPVDLPDRTAAATSGLAELRELTTGRE